VAEISLYSDDIVDGISELFSSLERNSGTLVLAPGHNQPPHRGYRPELCHYAPLENPITSLSGVGYRSDSIVVRSLPHATVFRDLGIVRDSNGHFVEQTLRALRHISPHLSDVSQAHELTRPAEGVERGNYIYAAHGNFRVFSHFLFETMLTAHLLKSLFSVGLVSLIVPSGFQTWPDALLDALGVPRCSRYPLERKSVEVGNLILSSTCSGSSTFAPNSSLKEMARCFLDKWGSKTGKRTRLYITRHGSQNTAERVYADDGDLSALLQDLNFITLNPATVSFEEQVKIFSEAEIVVGAHGSAFANLIFATKGCKVVDIIHSRWAVSGGGTFTANLTNLFEQEYVYLIADSSTTDNVETLRLDPKLVYDRVKRFLEG
jgi:capsular polysaccharide biosynthesis protein